MHTTLIDARTGARRTVHIDSSFGCVTRFHTTSASRDQRVYEVRWIIKRGGPRDQSRKFTCKEAASGWFARQKAQRKTPEFVIHQSGVHDVVF